MTLIDWDEKFTIGIAAVDHEHRELIDLINELYQSLVEKKDDTTVMDFLGEIYTRIAAHFALEEKVMRELGYSFYTDHKTDHEQLLDEIRDIMDDYEDNKLFADGVLAQRLKTWFGTHFRTKDAQLHKYLAETGSDHE